ncbi:hypothetical protein CPB84DRAFT_1894040 [Gymnopilus junonius]|uniref:Uncharacterized protein n=1 Tax=Gymnopilus junonius TaxID=109634 RepID=A0A9P5NBG2_GYMJU|nr:hypothetical protein CPB84DRAFT_1894040 [Gymnopilus junonius]
MTPLMKTLKAELIRNSQSSIRGIEKARKWLDDSTYTVKGKALTKGSLAMALLYLATGDIVKPKQLIDGMQAIAICLDVLPSEDRRGTVLEEAKGAIAEVVQEVTNMLADLAAKTQKLLKKAREEDKEQQGATRVMGWGVRGRHADQAASKSYSAALLYSGIATPMGVYGQEEMHRWQVLMDGVEGMKNVTDGLSPKQLVAKVNLAVEKIMVEWADKDQPESEKFVAVRVLINEEVVLEMEMEEAANWLRKAEVHKAFEKNFGGSAVIEDRSYNIVVEYLPASLKETLAGSIKVIENDNNLGQGVFTWGTAGTD